MDQSKPYLLFSLPREHYYHSKLYKPIKRYSDKERSKDVSGMSCENLVTFISEKKLKLVILLCHGSGSLSVRLGNQKVSLQRTPDEPGLLDELNKIEGLEILLLTCHAAQAREINFIPPRNNGGWIHTIATDFTLSTAVAGAILNAVVEANFEATVNTKEGNKRISEISDKTGDEYYEKKLQKELAKRWDHFDANLQGEVEFFSE